MSLYSDVRYDLITLNDYRMEFDKLDPYVDNSSFLYSFQLELLKIIKEYDIEFDIELVIVSEANINYDKFLKQWYGWKYIWDYKTTVIFYIENELKGMLDFLKNKECV